MKIYQILLWDTVQNSIDKVENHEGTEETLEARLLELQKGYCEDEEPWTERKNITSSNKKIIETIVASNDVDFCYISPIKEVTE